MKLLPWLRKTRDIFFADRVAAAHHHLLNVAEFEREASRERVRADRSGTPLSILVIELPPDRCRGSDYAFLGNVLGERLRITDTAGCLRDGRVAVLLPSTPKAGAWKVASDICDYYPPGHERPDCEVLMYPDDSTPYQSDSQNRSKQASDPSGAQLESLFAKSTPALKRGIDVLGATCGLIVAAPLLAIFGLLIKLNSRGPVLYSQWREGHGGRVFRIHKLRTMCVDAHLQQLSLRAFSAQDGPAFKMHNDPRITWIGRLLRRTSLDELPQLWNVLVGDMSLVGPRPLPTRESLECLPWQRQRLTVAPGLTCVWQVKGRSTVTFVEWMRMDLRYVRNRSFWYDLKLMLSTVPSLIFSRGPR